MKVGKKKSSLECLILEIGKKQCLGTGPTCLSDGAKVFLGAAAVEVPCCYPAGPYLPKLLLWRAHVVTQHGLDIFPNSYTHVEKRVSLTTP